MYIRNIADPSGAQVHVVGIPGAGGSQRHFRAWRDHLGARVRFSVVDTWALYLAVGDGDDIGIDDAAELLIPELSGDDANIVLVGHSRGALVAYETAQQLAATGVAARVSAIVAMAYRAPTSAPRQRLSGESDARLCDFMRRAGGTSPEVFDEPDLLRMVLDRLRAELRMAEHYKDPWRTPLPCRLRVYLGHDDDTVPAIEAQRWRMAVSGECVTRTFSGGHFFPFGDGRAAVTAAVLNDILAQGDTDDIQS